MFVEGKNVSANKLKSYYLGVGTYMNTMIKRKRIQAAQEAAKKEAEKDQ